MTNLKFPERGGASKKYTYPPPSPVWSLSGIAQCQWTGEFHPKSQKELLQKKFQTGGRVEDLKFLGNLGYIEKLCSRVQLKKELALPGVMKKVLDFSPSSSMVCNTIFPGLRDEASFCLEFLRSDKPKNSQFFFQRSSLCMSSHLSLPMHVCWTFSWMEPIVNYRLATTNKYIIIVVAYRL